jgi:hypothetical protein
MLNKLRLEQRDEILTHAEELGVNDRGLEYISNALTGPSRDASSGGLKSFGVNYASPVAGQTIQADSITVELKFLLRAHMCGQTLLCIDQPGQVNVSGRSPKGRKTRYLYTPDYLVIAESRIYGVECKSEDSLCELVRSRPFDYEVDQGRYQFVPANNYFNGMSMSFEVFSDSEVGQAALANYMLICPLQTNGVLDEGTQEVIQAARLLLERKPRTLSALIKGLGPGSEMALLVALANRELFGTLGSTSVNSPNSFTLFTSEAEAKRADLRELERSALDIESRDVRWKNSATSLSAADLRGAIRRLKRITLIERGEIKPNSNDRRIIAIYKQKLDAGAEPELAAATNYVASGHRGCRIADQIKVFNAYYKEHIAIPSPKSIAETHGIYKEDTEQMGGNPASYERFRQFVRSKDPGETALKQGGPRGLQSKTPVASIDKARPDALAAGEVVHVDSSPEDCRVFQELDGVLSLERPSIAVAVCERTQHLLGFAIAFGNASRFLLALLLRDIVRRWGFYPPWIANDGGPEHRANMWRNGLAWNRCSLIKRPGAAARAGQCVESAIRAINYGVPRKLSGSTRNDEANRSASNAMKSRATAVHHFSAVHEVLQGEFREFLDTTPKSFAHMSPREWFLEERLRRPVGFAADISKPMTLIETAVPIAVRKMDLDITRGLRVGLRNYSSLTLIESARSNRTFEEVRLDPEDPSIIYVKFADGWVTADSHDANELRELTDLERLVEGMHCHVRWRENKKIRTKGQVELNRKITELEARARSVAPPKSEMTSNRSPEQRRTDDVFARLSSGTTMRFPTNE